MLTRAASPVAVVAAERGQAKQKKPLVRRLVQDRSQPVRRAVQFAFVALNVWLALEFLLWARYFESGGRTRYLNVQQGWMDGSPLPA